MLQDARKGVLFDDFPPVLQLQLKRFEYDFQRDMMVKVGLLLAVALAVLSRSAVLRSAEVRSANLVSSS